VRSRLVAAEASRLAREEGEKLLASLKAQPQAEPEKFAPSTAVTRATPGELPAQVVTEVFRLPTNSLPAYAGVDLGPAGYQLVLLEKAEGPDAGAEARRQTYVEQLQRVLAQTAVSAYVTEVKSRTSIERKPID
jgi:peptidyl-prolyl cis-trans isomerase D